MLRVLLAKPGLDGHDKGIKVLASMLRDHGCEVIYTGLHQTPEMIATAAVQEDVDVVGLSMLSGAHVELTRDVLGLLEQVGLGARPVIVGWNIPDGDVQVLEGMGVTAVFGSGTPYAEILAWIDGVRRSTGPAA